MKLDYSAFHIGAISCVALMTLGCQAGGGSRWNLPGQRRTPEYPCRSQYAAVAPGYSYEQTSPTEPGEDDGIHPGHSIDSREEYRPALTTEPMYPAPPAPAPMPGDHQFSPRTNPDIPGSKPPAPLIEEEARLKNGAAPIHVEKVPEIGEPGRLSPFSVRSIYEKLRPKASESDEIVDGPIASNGRTESMARVVDFQNVSNSYEGVQPVTLGRPETEDLEFGGLPEGYTLPVMQATPSSYRHPMLADPTGMPYGNTR